MSPHDTATRETQCSHYTSPHGHSEALIVVDIQDSSAWCGEAKDTSALHISADILLQVTRLCISDQLVLLQTFCCRSQDFASVTNLYYCRHSAAGHKTLLQ